MSLASPKYPFKESAVVGAPADPGLYALYRGDTMICLGMAEGRGPSDTIRAKLLFHLNQAAPAPLPTHYKWEITSDPAKRRAQYLRALDRDR